jgi:hypothetical protein
VTGEEGELLAPTSRGLAKSLDAGLTWQLVPGTLDGTTVSALCRHPTRTGVFFASLFGGIFRSLDYGRTWRSLTVIGERPNDFVALVVLPRHPDWLFALSRSRRLRTDAAAGTKLTQKCPVRLLAETRLSGADGRAVGRLSLLSRIGLDLRTERCNVSNTMPRPAGNPAHAVDPNFLRYLLRGACPVTTVSDAISVRGSSTIF